MAEGERLVTRGDPATFVALLVQVSDQLDVNDPIKTPIAL
jgi:hypothetical protein